MKRLCLALTAAALATLLLATSAQAFDVTSFDVTYTNEDGSPATQAGSHPFAMTSDVQFSTKVVAPGKTVPDGAPKDLTVTLPAGLIGDRGAVPYCENADFLLVDTNHEFSACPNKSVLGVLQVRLPGETSGGDAGPAFNLAPPPGAAAKIGFVLLHVPVALLIRVSPVYPHNLIATAQNITNVEPIGGVTLTLWGNPADSAHDEERGQCLGGVAGACPAGIPERPLITLPRSCEGPLPTAYSATSWEQPAVAVTGTSASALQTTGCENLKLQAAISAHPTTAQAESASGLAFDLEIEDEGLRKPEANANSDIKKAVVRMPEGMTLNPSAAAGLESCTPSQLAAESLASEPGEGCPQAAKLGDVEVETQILANTVLHGQVFVAQQDDPTTSQPGAENPFDSFAALYMVIRDRDLGLFVTLAGKVETDPKTGQITTVFGEPGQEVPQFPVSNLRFRFREGPRGPLVTPSTCGDYTTTATFAPWANPASPLPTASTFAIDSGLGGGPCPTGTPPFKPGFSAGSTNNAAGAYSPFYLRLTRNDGEQEATRLDSILPKGVVAKIAGMPKCTDAEVAAAKGKSGRQELADPSCPPGSKIGSTLGGGGVGQTLAYVPGSVYLGGSFAGNPLSIIAITPAVAGPFDLGTVVVRQALSLDQSTGEAIIDGSHSDPIPHILEGVPLRLRDLRVYVDRPNFALNPTSCEPLLTKATLFGASLDPFSAADDVPTALTSPYRADNCAALKFKPKLSLKLLGGTKRSDHPALKSTLTYPKGPGYANVGRAVVTLPPSEFIDNAHIQNPCTRVQFNAHTCPKGSILGTAKAITPLLDEPLEGPVYFRSNGGERLLPDVVADLNGLFHIVLVGKIDATKGRIRTSFDQVPDAPVSKFTLDLRGGKKGLLVNSRNLCAKALKAEVRMTGQNGRAHDTRPVVKTSCKAKKKGKGKKQHRR